MYEPSKRISRTKTIPLVLHGELNNYIIDSTENKDKILEFVNRIEAIHWIDGHRFPTNEVSHVFTFSNKRLWYKLQLHIWLKKEKENYPPNYFYLQLQDNCEIDTESGFKRNMIHS